jgi:hypothetical protein
MKIKVTAYLSLITEATIRKHLARIDTSKHNTQDHPKEHNDAAYNCMIRRIDTLPITQEAKSEENNRKN